MTRPALPRREPGATVGPLAPPAATAASTADADHGWSTDADTLVRLRAGLRDRQSPAGVDRRRG